MKFSSLALAFIVGFQQQQTVVSYYKNKYEHNTNYVEEEESKMDKYEAELISNYYDNEYDKHNNNNNMHSRTHHEKENYEEEEEFINHESEYEKTRDYYDNEYDNHNNIRGRNHHEKENHNKIHSRAKEEYDEEGNRDYRLGYLQGFEDMTEKKAGSDVLGIDPVEKGDFPFFSAIREYDIKTVEEICKDGGCPDDSYIICGASLIAPDIILTAGHCQFDKDWVVYVGITETKPHFNGIERYITEKWTHPEFIIEHKPDGFLKRQEWDFQLAKLNKPVLDVAPAILNKDKEFPPVDGYEFVSLGLGKHSRDQVSKAFLNTVPKDKCKNGAFTGVAQICSHSNQQDVCTGDSGGPMVADDILVGIVSSGPQCAKHMDHKASVFALVSWGYDWIKEMVCEHSEYSIKTKEGTQECN